MGQLYCAGGRLYLTLIPQVMKAMEMEKEEMESEKTDLENQFEALKLMVEPYRCPQKSSVRFLISMTTFSAFKYKCLIWFLELWSGHPQGCWLSPSSFLQSLKKCYQAM